MKTLFAILITFVFCSTVDAQSYGLIDVSKRRTVTKLTFDLPACVDGRCAVAAKPMVARTVTRPVLLPRRVETACVACEPVVQTVVVEKPVYIEKVVRVPVYVQPACVSCVSQPQTKTVRYITRKAWFQGR